MLDCIIKYFPGLTEKQKHQFSQLKELYEYWNERINVISRRDIGQLYTHHVLPSLALVNILPFHSGFSMLDVGTGGGFPGIPLSIVLPGARFHLIDSTGKKIRVVNEVIAALGLENVTAQQIRVEDFHDTYDFVTGRAVNSFPAFVKQTAKNIKTNAGNNKQTGIYYFSGGDVEQDIKNFKDGVVVYPMDSFFQEEHLKTKKVLYLPIEKYKI